MAHLFSSLPGGVQLCSFSSISLKLGSNKLSWSVTYPDLTNKCECVGGSASFYSGFPDVEGDLHLVLGLTHLPIACLCLKCVCTVCEMSEPGWTWSLCVQSWCLLPAQDGMVPSALCPNFRNPQADYCDGRLFSKLQQVHMGREILFLEERQSVDDVPPTYTQSTRREDPQVHLQCSFLFPSKCVSSVGNGGQ